MRVVLIATYEMGRQPFGLASPAAWLRQAGATVVCQDLSRSRLDQQEIAAADVVALPAVLVNTARYWYPLWDAFAVKL